MTPEDKNVGKTAEQVPNTRLRPTYDLSRERWEKELEDNKNLALRDTPEGRAQIRLFSRGVLGAIGFTWGGWYARRATGLSGYSPERWNKAKPLHWVAKFFDTFAGKPIKAAVNMLGYDGERAVRFRATSFDFSPGKAGRTLGEEVVGITTDFWAMGMMDALGRDLCDLADKNVDKQWQNPDGSVDTGKAAKGALRAAWRYLSYNGGEDWAVGLPYAYWMKATRAGWNKVHPGFRYDFDRGLNGGSFKVNSHGELTGNYQIPGLLNLQERFTAYNIGTLAYREIYNAIGARLNGEQDRLYGKPDEPGPMWNGPGEFLKWGARTIMKGTLFMTPAVPFFWFSRTPQSKYKGLLISPEKDALLVFKNPKDHDYDSVHIHELARHDNATFNKQTPTYFNRYENQHRGWSGPTQEVPNPFRNGKLDPFGQSFGPIDSALNTIGKASNTGRTRMHHLPGKLGYHVNDFRGYKRLSDRYWNAAVSYTPYMWAKAETAYLWDNAKTDMAAERVIEGAVNLNWGEFKAGWADMLRAIAHQPLEDPAREVEAQRRMQIDNSPSADRFQESAYKRPPSFVARLQRITPNTAHTNLAPHTHTSFAEQVAMREAFNDMMPPTPSIH